MPAQRDANGRFIKGSGSGGTSSGIAVEVKTETRPSKVEKAAQKAAFTNFGHAAASIRKAAAKSIKSRKNKKTASPEGTAPFTHGGFIRRALRFDVNQTGAVIGFQRSVIGLVAATHEHGLTEEGRDYPERPTIGPALEESLDRIHNDWRSSIG